IRQLFARGEKRFTSRSISGPGFISIKNKSTTFFAITGGQPERGNRDPRFGANPVEYLLAALSGCLTTTMVAHAAARGNEIRKVESRYEGDIDLHGFLGLSDAVPVGYKRIGVYFKIDADVSEDQKEELVAMAQKYSPVFNSIAKPVPVSVQLDKK
ncbi:MAG: OsmC family protein, partial [Candidatus Deferrimicrobiaceae bacterium]